jgi:hypothetical protein
MGDQMALTRDEIIRMAQEAGIIVCFDSKLGRPEYASIQCSLPALETFANALRNTGLKEAAEVCEFQDTEAIMMDTIYPGNYCATTIRARIKESE